MFLHAMFSWIVGFQAKSIEWMDSAHQNYTATVNKKRWSHLWSVLGKNTAIGEVGIAYHEGSGKLAVLKRGNREHRAFGQGYQVIPRDKEVQEEPPCREVYN